MSHAATFTPARVLADAVPAVKARNAILVVAGALLTALCAQVSFPIPGSPVPVTGQTFAVLVCGAGLGAKRGLASQALYVGLGLVGLPFYADGASGVQVILGATGGYLVGFLIAAYVVGALAERRLDRSPLKALPVFTVGSLVIFAVGVPWLAVAADVSLLQAVELGLIPFIPGGILKALGAASLLPAVWRLVGGRH